MNKFLVLTILLFFQCATKKKYMSYNAAINPTVTAYVETSSTVAERQKLMNKFKVVLEDWADNHVDMGIYNRYDYKIHDVVIFNKKKDKALLFSSYLKERGRGSVDLVAARYIHKEKRWYFKHRGLPGFTYRFTDAYMENHAFSDEELLSRSIDQLVDDGLVKFNRVNQKYINTKWF